MTSAEVEGAEVALGWGAWRFDDDRPNPLESAVEFLRESMPLRNALTTRICKTNATIKSV